MTTSNTRAQTVLVVDIGNTNVTLGVYAKGRARETGRIATREKNTETLLNGVRTAMGAQRFDGVCIGSVVPAATRRYTKMLGDLLGVVPLVVNNKTELGVSVTYPRPETIGADRLANASGAIAKYAAPTIVMDFGTALTFDIIVPVKGYIGGVIAPGLPLMLDYLAERTALLPHITVAGAVPAVGKTTESAMRIGARAGYAGMVRGILEHLQTRHPQHAFKLVATGGQARLVLHKLPGKIIYDPTLTLFGLGRIFTLNQK